MQFAIMPQHYNTGRKTDESQIQLAIQALIQDPNLSVKRVAAIYNVPRSTLRDRRAGIIFRRDCIPNSMKLLPTEEQTILDHVLDLDAKGFPPRPAALKDLADLLLAERKKDPVGPDWPRAFIKRHPELKVKFSRKYDYKRALCEDPEIIQGWFRLVQNIKAKYGILDEDTYNFDETGFMMGQVSSRSVVTSSERHGRPKSIQAGNREWVTLILGINAMGSVIPPFIIFGGKFHLSAWFKEENLPPDWVVSVSQNGWTNNNLGLEWLRHFDTHTKRRTVGSYRLLIIDGHESHESL